MSKKVLRMVAPEFASSSEEEIDTWMELTSPFISEKIFGKLYKQALAYLTAHRMKMAGLGDNSYGTVADTFRVGSFNEGETSISFNTAQATNLLSDGELSLTAYGLSFLGIRRLVVIPLKTAGGIDYG